MNPKQHCNGAHICLVGKNRFQNEMFITTLKHMHQCQNTFFTIASLSDATEGLWRNDNRTFIFYLDCFGLDCRKLDVLMAFACQKVQTGNLMALFNFTGDTGLEKKALRYGVRGFFYLDDTPADFCRGIRVMLNGEIWLSRKKMSEMILAELKPLLPDRYPAKAGTEHLTAREKEVLTHLTKGASNETIASELHISVHTLRTHLYHIYRKIKVHNRIQASLWAENNL